MKIGDYVGSKYDVTKGYVLSIDKDKVLIKTDDDFELMYLKKDLIVYKSDLEAVKTIVKDNVSTVLKPKQKKLDVIDLHYKGKNLSANEILSWQLELFENELHKAIRKNLTEVVFIHGYGEGILKKEIEKILKKKNIIFSDAPFRQFGHEAAVLVHLKLNQKIIL